MTHTVESWTAAIVADPEDVATRLVYADWLDENAGSVPCPETHGDGYAVMTCSTCKATGRVPDGRKDRAEFVRVQCEIDGHPHGRETEFDCRDGMSPEYERLFALRRRERDLLDEHGFAFLAATFPQWKDCLRRDDTNNFHVASDPFRPGKMDPDFYCSFRRGFVEEVSLTAAAFCGGVCPLCHNSPVAAGWKRTCSACNSTGRTAGLAAALARACPLTSVTLVGMSPAVVASGLFVWWFLSSSGSPHTKYFTPPPELVRHMEGAPYKSQAGTARGMAYGSKDAAMAALSRACVAHARAAAGLRN